MSSFHLCAVGSLSRGSERYLGPGRQLLLQRYTQGRPGHADHGVVSHESPMDLQANLWIVSAFPPLQSCCCGWLPPAIRHPLHAHLRRHNLHSRCTSEEEIRLFLLAIREYLNGDSISRTAPEVILYCLPPDAWARAHTHTQRLGRVSNWRVSTQALPLYRGHHGFC